MKYPGYVLRIGLIFKIIVLALFALFLDDAAAELTARANHDHIKIDFFYHGSTVSVRGVSDPGTDLIITLSSPEGHEVLREKGKVGGLLWMTVGELKLDHAPYLYSVHSTKKIEDLLSKEERVKYGIGYEALRENAQLKPVSSDEEKTRWFNEFVKFKQSSNLYGASVGNISLTEKNGKQDYYILTQWPYQAPPGTYTATVYAVKNNRVIETATSKVLVEQVGIVKSLAEMAKRNGAVYGLLAIVSALGAGFGIGMVFGKGGGAH